MMFSPASPLPTSSGCQTHKTVIHMHINESVSSEFPRGGELSIFFF